MSELHLIILWGNARTKEAEILEDIKDNLDILKIYDIGWAPDKILSNYSRFYGVKLDDALEKEKDCGSSRFLAFIVRDNKPEYCFKRTSRGMEYVNKTLFSLKEKYRSWVGGSKIHTTNSIAEANHDMVLLLGKTYDDFSPLLSGGENLTVESLDQDLIGANGWDSLSQLFHVLNHTANYLVLRNFESLPAQYDSRTHGDIDLLVEDMPETALLMNGERVFREKHRVHYRTIVGGNEVFFDLRYLGDDYYCGKWERDLLAQKKLNDHGLYIPDDNSCFYTLVYHALIHKNSIADDYYEKTNYLAEKIGLPLNSDSKTLARFDEYFLFLESFMKSKNYHYTRPVDKSVLFQAAKTNTDWIKNQIIKAYPQISDIRPFLIAKSSDSGFVYFSGIFEGAMVFIKWGAEDEFVKNESLMTLKLAENNDRNFLKPILFKYNCQFPFLVYPYLQGKTLENVKSDLSDIERASIISQIKDIAQSLIDASIVHRDINMENLVWAANGNLYLMDMQFAVKADKYRELKIVRNNEKRFRHLGSPCARVKFKWDDMYSLCMVLEQLNVKGNAQSSYDSVHDFLKSNIGKYEVGYSPRMHLRRCWLRLKNSFVKRLRKPVAFIYEYFYSSNN